TQGVHDTAPRLGGSSLWGFARVVVNEHPELGSTLIDIDGTKASINALAEELFAPVAEDEVRLTHEGRAVHRVQCLSDVPCPEASLLRRVYIEHLGATTSVTTLAAPLPLPGRGQVIVAVRSVALGPWDARAVAAGRGMHGLGNIGVGVIAAVGEDVHDRVSGQEVVVLGHGLLATHALVDASHTAPVDTWLDHSTASAAALAALFAEAVLANLEPGEVVGLVGGASAMRRACEAVARRRRASVVSPGGDARRFRVVVHLDGSDALLNSVALVRSGGRLLVFDPGELGREVVSEAISRAITIESLDLPGRLDSSPDEAASLLRAATSLLPLDIPRPAQLSRDELGGRLPRSSEGPWVLSSELLPYDAFHDAAFRADATYLITGGHGGFGRTVAEWMVARGARHLVLLGRSGASTPKAREALERLAQAGACVTVERADVTNRSELERVLSRIRREHPPLRGLIHGHPAKASVLDSPAGGRKG
ncbi:MAG TPA: SDR family NAD(P)-dependent oxidoreductase, partial [Archangium sp.]|nr:SDR family NAD(P)-dependent oxidoreductase [Archangium sp.]